MALNPEEQLIQYEEARAWCLRAVRDLPEHAIPELTIVLSDLQKVFCNPLDVMPLPKGKPS